MFELKTKQEYVKAYQEKLRNTIEEHRANGDPNPVINGSIWLAENGTAEDNIGYIIFNHNRDAYTTWLNVLAMAESIDDEALKMDRVFAMLYPADAAEYKPLHDKVLKTN